MHEMLIGKLDWIFKPNLQYTIGKSNKVIKNETINVLFEMIKPNRQMLQMPQLLGFIISKITKHLNHHALVMHCWQFSPYTLS